MTAEQPLLVRLLKQGQYTLLMALVEKGVYFLLFALLARSLDTPAYGSVVAMFTFVNILHAFFEFGFGAYLQRDVSSGSDDVRTLIGTVLQFKVLAFIPFSVIAVLYSTAATGSIDAASAAIIVSVYCAGMAALLAKVLYGKGMFRESFTAMASSRIIVPAGAALILLSGLPVITLIGVLGLAYLLQIVMLYSAVVDTLGSIRWSFDRRIFARVIRSSLPMGLGVSFVWTYDKLDVLLIQHLIDPTAVAMYTVAYSIYKFPQILSGIILSPLYTVASSTFSREGKLYRSDFRQPAAALILISVVMIAVMCTLPEMLLTWAFGERYAGSAGALQLLSLALPALFLNNMTGVLLNAARRETSAMVSALTALLTNITANIIVLPMAGYMGAVFVTIITEYSILGIQLWMLHRSGVIHRVRSL